MSIIAHVWVHFFVSFNLYAGCGASVPVAELHRSTDEGAESYCVTIDQDAIKQLFLKSFIAQPDAHALYKIHDYLNIAELHGFTHELVRACDPDGNTPLHLACKHKHLLAAHLLADTSAPVGVKNRFRQTPIDFCTLHCDGMAYQQWELLRGKLRYNRQLQRNK